MLTWLEIDSKAIEYNLRQFRKLIGPRVLLMPVIKANAYGHGFLGVAKICQQSKDADRICVVSLDEALELIKNKIKKPILILSFFDQDEKKLILAIKNGVIFPLYSQKTAKLLNRAGERAGKKVKVHLKVDVGTTRVGIFPTETINFVNGLKKYKHVELEGIWSHFASSEEDQRYTQNQYNIFKSTYETLERQGISVPIKHIACSAAAILYHYTHENALRLGLGLYGLYPSEETKHNKINLKPALSWHTKIIQTKIIPTGAKIGYGSTYQTTRPTKIAVIPVGYWDGYDRRLSNKAYVLIKGSRCPIIGRICMNLSMVDITNLNVKEGERVTLIGKSGDKTISVDEVAKWADTINYEIIDRINPLLPRMFK